VSGYEYTGKSATLDQDQAIRAAGIDPLAARRGPRQGKSQSELIHEAALAAGLPDFEGMCGYDLGRHEFIRWAKEPE